MMLRTFLLFREFTSKDIISNLRICIPKEFQSYIFDRMFDEMYTNASFMWMTHTATFAGRLEEEEDKLRDGRQHGYQSKP